MANVSAFEVEKEMRFGIPFWFYIVWETDKDTGAEIRRFDAGAIALGLAIAFVVGIVKEILK